MIVGYFDRGSLSKSACRLARFGIAKEGMVSYRQCLRLGL
jgi:hypothetical protein